MRTFDRVIERLAWLGAILAGLCLLAMMLLIALEVILRALNHSLLMVDEYSGYMVLAVLGFGWAYAFHRRALLKIELIQAHLSYRTRRILGVIYASLALAFCLVLVWRLGLFAWTGYLRGNVASTPMLTPLWIPQALVPAGLVLVVLVAVKRLIAAISGEVDTEPTPIEAEE
jgi:TRAP-type transport system small permease protein